MPIEPKFIPAALLATTLLTVGLVQSPAMAGSRNGAGMGAANWAASQSSARSSASQTLRAPSNRAHYFPPTGWKYSDLKVTFEPRSFPPTGWRRYSNLRVVPVPRGKNIRITSPGKIDVQASGMTMKGKKILQN